MFIFILLLLSSTEAQQNVENTSAQIRIIDPKVSIDSLPRNTEFMPYIDIDAHSRFQIECEGNKPLIWMYPNFHQVTLV